MDQYCCSGQYANPNTCKPSYYSSIFKRACPRAYSYAFDDGTSTFTCNAYEYAIIFCPNSNNNGMEKTPEPGPLIAPAIKNRKKGNTTSNSTLQVYVSFVNTFSSDPTFPPPSNFLHRLSDQTFHPSIYTKPNMKKKGQLRFRPTAALPSDLVMSDQMLGKFAIICAEDLIQEILHCYYDNVNLPWIMAQTTDRIDESNIPAVEKGTSVLDWEFAASSNLTVNLAQRGQRKDFKLGMTMLLHKSNRARIEET
ncbi:thaumatin [Artemisia annua]|uniref:Thaumatin n=1 Tax=Artemisia annua TaxID=35608 RepID=A0A2U1N1I9_ARTAN|nr:thaumatin [Artemisia annua]